MKNLKRLFVLLFALVLVIPFGVFAEGNDEDNKEEKNATKIDNSKYSKYNTTNFVETLEAENIELKNKDYTENGDQVIIYMFRGQGCSHCREFLTFLNELAADEEYAYKFRLVAFETWKDETNSKLMSQISKTYGEEATGVPYIIIGNQVLPGYSSTYDDQIKSLIDTIYNTKVSERVDAFDNIKEPKDHSVAVGICTVLVIGGIAALAVITRKNNG